LWKYKLDEPILGKVHTVDMLKNNKLQFAFNTKHKIFVIDRLGKDVAPFPVSLASISTAPMSVFDYEKNREYRFFVPCANGTIAAIDRNGKAVDGFVPNVKFGVITQPVLHVRRAGKDFIVVTDNLRVHLLDRKGKRRLPTTDIYPATNTLTCCEYAANGAVARLVVSTANGNLMAISLDNGRAEKIPIDARLNEMHHFVSTPSNGYMFLNNKTLSVYASNLKQIFSESTKQAPYDKPLFFNTKNKQYYSVYSADERKAYLWDADGNLLKGFPINASAPAIVVKMTKSSDYQIVVGDENGFVTWYAQ